jgi:dolichol-phosphate mannosyltransferase
MSVELAIIIPTLNERDNIEVLVERIRQALSGLSWELVFVDDDSKDGTLEVLQRLAQSDRRIRYLRRVGRHGLSSACLEGMATTAAPVLAVMDADLQHDESILPRMLHALQTGQAELVIGSRYLQPQGDSERSASRRWLSTGGSALSRLVVRAPVSDPLSGYFMLTRALYERMIYRVSGRGFKLLLDILLSLPRAVKYQEVPYVFRERHAGESKLDTLVVVEYAHLLIDKTIGRIVPMRFVLFAAVGSIGACLHLALLAYFYLYLLKPFAVAQSVATLAAIAANFLLNNLLTYRDLRLKGWGFLRGLVFFYFVCAAGAVANVALASFLYATSMPWWFAGLIGALLGGVWNFAITSVLVWIKPRPKEPN